MLERTISIHALRKESDVAGRHSTPSSLSFQSTLSVRRATLQVAAQPCQNPFQSTLSVRRATSLAVRPFFDEHISIHALRKESDLHDVDGLHHVGISIHALRKESDHRDGRGARQSQISIHALRKESDRRLQVRVNDKILFQSTLSVRRATHTFLPL